MTMTMAAWEVGIVLVTRITRVYAADRMTMEGACTSRNLPAEGVQYLAEGHKLNSLLFVGLLFVCSTVELFKTCMPRIR